MRTRRIGLGILANERPFFGAECAKVSVGIQISEEVLKGRRGISHALCDGHYSAQEGGPRAIQTAINKHVECDTISWREEQLRKILVSGMPVAVVPELLPIQAGRPARWIQAKIEGLLLLLCTPVTNILVGKVSTQYVASARRSEEARFTFAY